MTLQGKDYAQVKDRIIQFRSECPNGLIETHPLIQENGQILFKARILKDKSNPDSAEATGHALGDSKAVKGFEKLETIAVGRALALLGYGSDGEIASSDEMEEFYEHKEQQHQDYILEMTERLACASTIEELKEVWGTVDGTARVELESLKEQRKKDLSNDNTKIRQPRTVATSPKGKDNGVTA